MTTLQVAATVLLVLLLAVVGPIWDYVEGRKLQRDCPPEVRLQYYQSIVALLWILTLIAFLARPADDIWRFRSSTGWPAWVGLAFGAVFTVGVVGGFLAILVRPNLAAQYAAQVRTSPFQFIFPRTSLDRKWFAAVSLSAGICEEILFRGFLLQWMAETSGSLAVGIVGSSVAFGLNHCYQGWSGVARTALIGAAFGVLFCTTGSLLLPIVLHALIDLQVLAILKPGWENREPSEGVVETPDTGDSKPDPDSDSLARDE